MHASKRLIASLTMVFLLTVGNCCDTFDSTSVCKRQSIFITVSFENPFNGTIFANGYDGNSNCSLPNMETEGSTIVALSLHFMLCNTIIKRIEGNDNLQAMNTITIQFHPLIKSVLDCEIIATCDIDYPLPHEFLRSYLNRDLELPTPVNSKLDIMSGEKLLGDVMAGMLKVSQKQYLVLNVKDGGKHDQLRIRKCYAHASYVIDQITTPDLLLDDNQCSGEGISRLTFKADKSYSDLTDFSEVQNFEISFTQKSFYITCAFDMCLNSCLHYCYGDMEIKKNRWSTVRTHRVGLFDKSFKGFSNRNIDLRTSVKIFTDRLLKLKDQQIAQKSTIKAIQRTPRLDTTEHLVNIDVSPTFKEETVTKHGKSDTLVQVADEISTTVDSPDVSEGLSAVNGKNNVTKHSFENVMDAFNNLNFSETKASERFGKRSIVKEEIDDSDNSSDTIVGSLNPSTVDLPLISTVDLPLTSIVDTADESIKLISGTDCFNSSCRPDEDAGISNKSEMLMNGTDCFNTSCRPDEDARSILASEMINNNTSSEDSSLKFDETTSSDSDFNLNISNDEVLATDNSTEGDCVPHLQFITVTLSLLLLCIFLFIIVIGSVLYIRKERKRYDSHCKYLYNDFLL